MLSAVLLGLTVMACASRESKSDEELITDVARTMVEETLNGDPAVAYGLLDMDTQASCDRDTFLRQWSFIQNSFLTLKFEQEFDRVEDIVVTGDTATAKIFTRTNGSSSYYEPHLTPFKKERGHWKLAECY